MNTRTNTPGWVTCPECCAPHASGRRYCPGCREGHRDRMRERRAKAGLSPLSLLALQGLATAPLRYQTCAELGALLGWRPSEHGLAGPLLALLRRGLVERGQVVDECDTWRPTAAGYAMAKAGES